MGQDERFEIRGAMGSGASGTVHEAFDRIRGELVALKVMDDEPRLRRDFAELRALNHEGLVKLHELIEYEGGLLVSMERVNGVDFVSYVRAPRARGVGRPTLPLAFGVPLQEGSLSAFSPATVDEIARLRPALAKLQSAITALHDIGRVHRDLSPQNVLVEPDGRVAVLDFGLLADIGASREGIVGTAEYLAPEDAITEANDWYAVGVLLFQCLTGALPFTGSAQEIMVRKQTVSAPRASFVVDLPEEAHDLDELCERLLRRDPAQRSFAQTIRVR